MYLPMDTMSYRFKILIHSRKLDIKEEHNLEDTVDHKKNSQDMKNGMMIIFMKIMEIILMLAKDIMDIANQLELYPYTAHGDIVVPKPQASTYKSWPREEDTPKVAFKDHSKPKVEEKGKLITNPTRCFKCNGVGHIAINCHTKRTLVFSEDLNGWIEKGADDYQEDIFKGKIVHGIFLKYFRRLISNQDTIKLE
ncbi:hypothetical protein M9H77_30290 [Catharanthus roseus]|uniref:Uncharacterized protein n=1 Tax=Catharanthus roseus TaxID=4058 RepID=A0ACB9ZZ41_CATRO|nr:hypothetical protein M9H77_30290 [Catharanthus roseus]